MRIIGLAAVCLIAAPTIGVAQQPSFDGEIHAAAALGLTSRALPSGPALSLSLPEAPPLARPRRHDKSLGVTLMLIGGGAVVVGAIAGGGGGTVLVVGGLVCAGYGFYLYTE